ncbi:hypothetical protein [Streptomyces megasporus]|uniref:hypothetical protein n=1 Tax=Streptomyces megasporus TaxID=44060 RepID=UPI00068F0A87|nr:hypothetical protein [Streptomyces megasporus]
MPTTPDVLTVSHTTSHTASHTAPDIPDTGAASRPHTDLVPGPHSRCFVADAPSDALRARRHTDTDDRSRGRAEAPGSARAVP